MPASYSRRISPSNLNKSYLAALSKYPLLTKSLTGLVLSAFNEQIASFIAGDLKEIKIKLGSKEISLKHTLTARVPLMALYGCLLNAPITHYGYKLLNNAFSGPLTGKKKLAQILTSMVTITPVISFITVSYIALINNAKFKQLSSLLLKRDFDGFKNELKELFNKVKTSLVGSLFPVIKSSWISGPIFMSLAQKFLEPNVWAVFFSFCYFILGTYNNTQVKKRAKSASIKEELKKEAESIHPVISSSSEMEYEVQVIEAQDVDLEVITEEPTSKEKGYSGGRRYSQPPPYDESEGGAGHTVVRQGSTTGVDVFPRINED